MTLISGVITDPALRPVAGARIELRALNSALGGSLFGSVLDYRCDDKGGYSFLLLPGYYDTYVQNDDCGDLDYLGVVEVTKDTIDGDIASILINGGIDITPPLLDDVLAARDDAIAAAGEAKTSAEEAAVVAGEVAADAERVKPYRDEAEGFAESAGTSSSSAASSASTADAAATSASDSLNRMSEMAETVQNNADAVSIAATQVQEDADLVSQLAGEVRTDAAEAASSATVAGQDAAKVHDELTQVVALSGDAVAAAGEAEYYAKLAEQYAAVMTGVLIDAGSVDLSSGTPPTPVMIGGEKASCFWKVIVAGMLDVEYGVGDTLIYTAPSDSYYKIDNTESVTKVNDKTGVVTLSAEDVDAAPVDHTHIAAQALSDIISGYINVIGVTSMMVYLGNDGIKSVGEMLPGSNLIYASSNGSGVSGGTPAGTWMLLGTVAGDNSLGGYSAANVSLFIRVA
jgi:hypothetical protein